jgi:hypothetical protein
MLSQSQYKRQPRRWKLTPQERDVATIYAVPSAILPDLEVAQLLLIGLIHAGHPVRAVERTGAWYVRLDELGRDIPLHTWNRHYAAVLAEVARTLETEGGKDA